MANEQINIDTNTPGIVMLWLILRNFKPSEAWGDPNKMDPLLLFFIDTFRATLPQGCWIKVHCGYKEGGHTINSYHYLGKAIDWHVEGMPSASAEAHLMRFLKEPKIINGAEFKLIDFMGVGVYPQWANPGFHTDTRGKRASWSQIDGKYVAYDLGVSMLKTI